jgi:DNA polymerase III subunit gamma/tau
MRSGAPAGGAANTDDAIADEYADYADMIAARAPLERTNGRDPAGFSPERAAANGGAPTEQGTGRPLERSASRPSANSDAPANPATDLGEPWSTLIGRLELGGAARQLASNCHMMSRQGSVIRLALDARNKHMRTPAQEEKLAQALSRHFGQPIRLEFEMASSDVETPAQADQRASMEDLDAARRAFESDPGVQGLKERFGATLLPETIRPVK